MAGAEGKRFEYLVCLLSFQEEGSMKDAQSKEHGREAKFELVKDAYNVFC